MQSKAYTQRGSRQAPFRLIGGEVSIEVSPDQARKFRPDPNVFPRGSRVFLPHLKGKDTGEQVDAAKMLIEMGYVPVPHFGARNFESIQGYVNLVEAHTRNGVKEGLFLGGNPLTASGPLSDAAQLLAHPVLSNSSIKTAHLGGYPEGHPAISEEALWEAMKLKLALCAEKALATGIVSQFAFDGEVISKWARRVQSDYPGLPIRIGVAGVTSLPKLIKFAIMCGIGPSLAALRRSSVGLINILSDKDPADLIQGIETAYPSPAGQLEVHFFPFGGWQKTLDWVAIARSSEAMQDLC
jgi:methylenetetrahydrofolate reductase (NADPH)